MIEAVQRHGHKRPRTQNIVVSHLVLLTVNVNCYDDYLINLVAGAVDRLEDVIYQVYIAFSHKGGCKLLNSRLGDQLCIVLKNVSTFNIC